MADSVQSANTIGSRAIQTYTSFSGVDITAIADDKTIKSITGLSCSSTREKAPVYTFGSANPRAVSRGKRGHAGSMVFTLFDRDPMRFLMEDRDHWYYAHRDEVNWLNNPVNVADPNLYDLYGTDPANIGGGATDTATILDNSLLSANRERVPYGNAVDGQAVTVFRMPIYGDQLMPFDISLVAQNEYGQAAWSSIHGVEIINEGNGYSIDDITSEIQLTYIALHRETWREIEPGDGDPRRAAETAVGFKDGRVTVVTDDSGSPTANWAPYWARNIYGER